METQTPALSIPDRLTAMKVGECWEVDDDINPFSVKVAITRGHNHRVGTWTTKQIGGAFKVWRLA